jgi:nucleolar protein 14
MLKREAKGAARELRKDNYFLLEVKDKERALKEKARAEKYGKTKAFLQEQERAFKSGQLGKGRKRSR